MVSRSAGRVIGLLIIMLLVGVGATMGQAGALQVRTDRQPILEGESFRLMFETGQEPGGSPDFSVLERDFEIVSKQQGSRFQSINGQRTHQTSWTVTLLARQAGTFTIPPIAFGRERSPEYTVTIHKESPVAAKKSDHKPEDLFLEVSTAPEKVYVQSQVIYTIRFFRSVEISGASLTEPQLDAADAVIEKLGEDHSFETRRDGVHYLVVERRYALFPQRSGRLTIAPLRLEAQMGKRGLFNLFEDSFQAKGSDIKRRHSAAVELDVEPIPPGWPKAPWLPANRLQLMEKWSDNPPRFQVGEAVTRTLTLLADGLTSAQLPEITETGQTGASATAPLKRYPDQPVLTDQREKTGIIGMRQEKVALVPSQPGPLVLPAIEVAWWNVGTQMLETARLPERTVTVIGETTNPQATLHATETSRQAGHKPPVTSLPAKSEDAHRAEAEDGSVPETKTDEQAGYINVFNREYPGWVTHCLAAGWFVTVIVVWLHPRVSWRSRRADRSDTVTVNSVGQSLSLLKLACLQNDPAKARFALLVWARGCWPDQTLQHVNDLQRLLQRMGLGTLVQEVTTLNRALFSPASVSWSGQALWEAVADLPGQTGRSVEALPPLYPWP
ncbi:MAG: BatD family protein [Magnetococcus sp. DMHC-8]